MAGTVHHIQRYADTNEVMYLIVVFDNAEAGTLHRLKYQDVSNRFKSSNGTPIFRIKFTYKIGSSKKTHEAKATIEQFPFKLAWAVTAHKCQGQTIKAPTKIVCDLASIWGPNQAYVMLSRVQKLEQLHIVNFDLQKIYCSKECQAKVQEINSKSEEQTTCWYKEDVTLRLSSLNIRSLNNHMWDLLGDHTIMKSDIICLSETWITPEDQVTIPGWNISSTSTGRGRGVVIAYKEGEIIYKFSNKSLDFIVLNSKNINVIAVYVGQGFPPQELLQFLGPYLIPNTIVIGDFNMEPNNNYFTNSMQSRGYHQKIEHPTHDKGSILDHLYTNITTLNTMLHSVFYSDHDCICAYINKE